MTDDDASVSGAPMLPDGNDPPMRLKIGRGTRLPDTRYEVTGWLGEGGMGTVYEATHLDLDRRVAVKVLHPELCTDPQQIDAFRTEARTTSHVGCEQIVTVHDFVPVTGGRLLYVMELLDGDPLDRARTEPVPVEALLGLLRQACKGLQAAHDTGVIHRDVKPANLFLLRQTERPWTIKVMDFGIAELTAVDAPRGELAGSPSYMAPEQIRAEPCDARTDVYGLGCTAYELLVGRSPFEHRSMKETLRGHLTRSPSFPADATPPKPVADLILKCLEKRPADRWQSMADLEAGLCEAQIALDVTTAWDHLPIPDVDPDRRAAILANMPDPATAFRSRVHPGLLVASGAVILAAGLVVVGVTGRGPEAVEVEQRIAREARDAAARARYVYPPSGEADAVTAYRKVIELEELDTSPGEDIAIGLRAEFAQTLIGLGDHYWARPGGRAFAVDYYAQAVLFDGSDDQARSRAMLTPGQLGTLAAKAEHGDFAEGELDATEPLHVLANPASLSAADVVKLADHEVTASPRVQWSLHKLAESYDVVESATEQPVTPRPTTPQPTTLAQGPTVNAPSGPEPPPSLPEPEAQETRRPHRPTQTSERVSSASRPAEVEPPTNTDPAAAARLASSGSKRLRAQDLGGAERHFNRALAADPKCGSALIGMSDVYFERDRLAGAIAYARRAIGTAPKAASYRLKLGDAYFRASRFSEARAAYEKARTLGSPKAEGRLKKIDHKLAGD